MTSDQIFEIIFGRVGRGRLNLKGATCSFAREFVDVKYALRTLPKGKRKLK